MQARILASPRTCVAPSFRPEAMEADSDHASPYAMREGSAREIPMLKGLNAIAPAGAVQSSVRDLARWLAFHATRSPELLGEEAWRDLHRPRAEMPAPDEPEVQHPSYALGWIHESYRGHTLVVHDGAIDGFTVHLGFLPETGQGLIILMNRERAAEALMAHRLQRLRSAPRARAAGLGAEAQGDAGTGAGRLGMSRSTFRSRRWRGATSIPRTGCSRSGPTETGSRCSFGLFVSSLVYQGERRFLSLEPIVDSAPQISVRFSKPKPGEPLEALRSAQLR